MQQHVRVWVTFELHNESSNFFFSICFNLFDSGMWNARDSKINTMVTATSLPVLMNFVLTIIGFFFGGMRYWSKSCTDMVTCTCNVTWMRQDNEEKENTTGHRYIGVSSGQTLMALMN